MANPVKCAIWAFLGAIAGTKAVIDGVNAAKERKAKKEAKKQLEENADSKEN